MKNKDIIKAIEDFHSDNGHRKCSGCDSGDYAVSDPDWPCRTWLLIQDLKNKKGEK